jgi:cytochrome c-type biogenesis protein CcmH
VKGLLVLLFVPLMAWGNDADLDRRVTELSQELRCLVCQNQTLAESNAPLAVDLRNRCASSSPPARAKRT